MERRDFLKKLGIGAGALALAEVGRQTLKNTPEILNPTPVRSGKVDTEVTPFNGYDIDWDWAQNIQDQPMQPDLIVGSQDMFDHYADLFPVTDTWVDTGENLITLTDQNTIWDGTTFTVANGLYPSRTEMNSYDLDELARNQGDHEAVKVIQERMNRAANMMVDNINQEIYFSDGFSSTKGVFNDPSFSDTYREYRAYWADKVSG